MTIKISFLVTNKLGNILLDWKEIKMTALRADIEEQSKKENVSQTNRLLGKSFSPSCLYFSVRE
jgi:hypothetical protein